LLEKWIHDKWFCFEKHENIFVGVHENFEKNPFDLWIVFWKYFA
jgi:hypothetical protein